MDNAISLTEDQRRVLEFYKSLGARWLAVDKDGGEYFYRIKPMREDEEWRNIGLHWSNQMQQYNGENGLRLSTWEDKPLNLNHLLGLSDTHYWDSVPIDSKVEVFCPSSLEWVKRYFAGVEDGKIYYFLGGTTSWSNRSEKVEVDFEEIRLYE